MHTKQNKELIHYFPSSGRCSAISRKAGLHYMQWLLGKTNAITPSASLFLTAFIAEHDTIRYGMSLWSVGVSCPSCVPSQLLAHPQQCEKQKRS